jgi:hypothetical protein
MPYLRDIILMLIEQASSERTGWSRCSVDSGPKPVERGNPARNFQACTDLACALICYRRLAETTK